MKSFAAPLLFTTTVLAASRTSAPSASCLTVGKSGAKYTTIQAAVDALSTTDSASQCIFITAGTYNEQVLVASRTAQLSIYGETKDTTSYKDNVVTITASKSQADGLNNDQTGTLRVKANNFKLYNVNVNNGYGKGSQAIALSAYATSGYYGVQLTGFQDTLLAQTGNQVYANSLIQGATDFIFGQNALAWFENVDIRVLTASIGYVTANGRTTSSNPSYYVFNKCDVAAASGNTVSSGAYYLGRPWSQYARVVFQETSMSSVINSAGWSIWQTTDPRTDNVLFGEYKNTGAGASGTRATFAKSISTPVAITTILGSGYTSEGFYDASYF